MKIYVPYVNLGPQTVASLREYGDQIHYILMQADDGYPNFLQYLWGQDEKFIIVEQDVVPWPGAIEDLWACPEPWCAFGYGLSTTEKAADDLTADGACAYLGCAKIDQKIMRSLPELWSDMPNRHWSKCDCHMTYYARKYGFNVHQHFPSVTNGKP